MPPNTLQLHWTQVWAICSIEFGIGIPLEVIRPQHSSSLFCHNVRPVPRTVLELLDNEIISKTKMLTFWSTGEKASLKKSPMFLNNGIYTFLTIKSLSRKAFESTWGALSSNKCFGSTCTVLGTWHVSLFENIIISKLCLFCEQGNHPWKGKPPEQARRDNMVDLRLTFYCSGPRFYISLFQPVSAFPRFHPAGFISFSSSPSHITCYLLIFVIPPGENLSPFLSKWLHFKSPFWSLALQVILTSL